MNEKEEKFGGEHILETQDVLSHNPEGRFEVVTEKDLEILGEERQQDVIAQAGGVHRDTAAAFNHIAGSYPENAALKSQADQALAGSYERADGLVTITLQEIATAVDI